MNRNQLRYRIKNMNKKDALFATIYIPTSIITGVMAILISNKILPNGYYKVLGISLSLLAVTPLLLMLGIGILKKMHLEVYG